MRSADRRFQWSASWWEHRPDAGVTGERRARSRALGAGIATSVLCKAIAAIGPLVLIPITLDYLGPDLYGLWMTVLAVTSMAMWADLGLGFGLMTQLARSHAERDVDTARKQVSTTYALVIAVGVVLLVFLWLLAPVVPWSVLLAPADVDLAGSSASIALICFTAFVINIPLSLVHQVQYSAQRVSVSNVWQAGCTVASVFLAAGAVRLDLGATYVVAAAAGGPLVVNLLNTLYTFLGPCRQVSPRPRCVDSTVGLRLLRLGSQFFVISICTSLALNVDSVIIAHTIGLDAVTGYSVTARVFLALGMIVTVINMPLWPAAGGAIARRDREWILTTTRRMTLVSGITVAVAAVLIWVVGGAAVSAWTSGAVEPDRALLAALSVWWLLLATASPRFMVQNSAGVLGPQLVGWCLFLVVTVPVKWFAAELSGVAAVVWTGAVGYLLILWPTAAVGFRRVTARASNRPVIGGAPAGGSAAEDVGHLRQS